jgi:hypothetical protein
MTIPSASRRARSILVFVLAAGVLALVGNRASDGPSVKDKKKKGSVDLAATTLSFRVKDRKIADVLKHIATKTKNSVQIVDDFGRPASDLLAQKVTLRVKDAPFWEVVGKIESATETRVMKFKDGEIHLSKPTDFNSIGREPAIGDSVIAGSLRATPTFKSFFHHVIVSIQPEPRLGRFEAGEARLSVIPKKGDAFELEQHSFSGENSITRFLDLQFELEKDFKKIPLESIARLKVEGHVEAVTWETKQIGTVAKLLAGKKARKVGLVTVHVKSAAAKEKDGERLFVIQLDVDGPFVTQQDFFLLGRDGKRIDLHGGSANLLGNPRAVELQYSIAKVGKKPTALRLSLHTPTKTTKVPIEFEFSSLRAPKK